MKKPAYGFLSKLLCAGLILSLVLCHLASVVASAAGEDILSAENSAAEPALKASSPAGTIHIGDAVFRSDEDVSSGWSDGRGWKNLAGQYVAMVDYNGAEKTVSRDGGILTLAVAGVNRIGELSGDCSVRIFGTGIVLIDKISLSEGNTLSLHPNTSVYEEGSAAVFLKQGDSYLCINGSIPGILDENYTLEDVKLTLPGGTSMVLAANTIDFKAATGKLTLGKGSTLTVDSGASIRIEALLDNTLYLTPPASALVLQGGTAAVNGTAEGPGSIDVEDGGFLKGSGTVQSAFVNLYSGGTLSTDLLIENSRLAAYENDIAFSARIKNSAVFLKANGVDVKELQVQGTCWLGVDTPKELGEYYYPCKLGDVTFSSGSSLSVVCNEHGYAPAFGQPARYVEDCYLEIYGSASGGTVSVLAGCAEYTGTQTANLPAVPEGYTSRVYLPNIDIDSTLYPMNMSKADAAKLVRDDSIRVVRMTVHDTLVSNEILARKWVLNDVDVLDPLSRKDNPWFNCQEFLAKYGQPGGMSENSYCTAVEVIYSDLSRDRFFYDQTVDYFQVKNVIEIRIIDCIGKGGQGGTALSHTDTIFTGSGTLGGTGDGSASGGNGTTVYPKYGTAVPTEPETIQTEAETTQTEAATTEKVTTSTEKTTKSTEKTTHSTEKTTSPTEKTTERTSESTEKTTRSGENETETSEQRETTGHSQETTRHSQETTRHSQETTRYSWETTTRSQEPEPTKQYCDPTDEHENSISASVTEIGNGRYALSFYRDGVELEGPEGQTVPVTVRDPEWVTENDVCYAVFEDGAESTWIPAGYDSGTGELTFTADRTGTFGVARVTVEDVTYPAAKTDEPLYRRMTIHVGTDDVPNLPVAINARVLLTDAESAGAGLFAVFVNEQEELSIFPMIREEDDDRYRLETDRTGCFALVDAGAVFGSGSALYDATGLGSALYSACSASEEVRLMITILRLEAFWN